MDENRSSTKSARSSAKYTTNEDTKVVSVTPGLTDLEVTPKIVTAPSTQDTQTTSVDTDGVTYMTWTHVSDTAVEKPIFSKHSKFRSITEWKRQVFTHCWFPSDKPPTAFMIMCHGLHEHAARYDNYMRGIVVRTGLCVVAVDWPGHGRSCDEQKGPEGRMPSFHLFIHDALSLVERVTLGNYPAGDKVGAAGIKDWYLFGHSMGGCIAINLVLERPGFFKAVCLSAPLTDATYGQAGKCLLVPLLSCMSSIVPNMILTFSPLITPNQLSHDLAEQDKNANDKLCIQNQVRTRLSYELVKATKRIRHEASTITDPICVVHSTGDAVVPEGATEEFLGRISSEDVKFEKLKEWFHELHNEGTEGLEFMVNIFSSWIEAHPPTLQ